MKSVAFSEVWSLRNVGKKEILQCLLALPSILRIVSFTKLLKRNNKKKQQNVPNDVCHNLISTKLTFQLFFVIFIKGAMVSESQ